jgi:putative N6-adenine-specific DNA methylase
MLFEAIHLVQKQEILRLQASPSAQDDTSERIKTTPSHISHSALNITLFDLMAGSGTFSLEAAYTANKIIPGVCRDFALKHQPAFKEATWNYIIKNLESASTSCKAIHNPIIPKIVTSDISERAIEIIKHNVESSPLAGIAPSGTTPIVNPQLKDFFSYTAKEIAEVCDATSPVIVLNPPYGKRLDFDAPKLYTKIGRHLTTLANELKDLEKSLTVAILAPKDDSRESSKFTCTANLLRECPALDPNKNSAAKLIETSHGGFSLNTFIARI